MFVNTIASNSHRALPAAPDRVVVWSISLAKRVARAGGVRE